MNRRTKRMVLLVAVLIAGASVPAEAWGQVGVGARGGLNLADLTGDFEDSDSFESRTRAVFGLSVELPLGGLWSLQPEVLFNQTGVLQREPGGVSVTLGLDYLQIPVLLKARLPAGGRVQPHLALGPALSFELDCSVQAEQSGLEADFECSDPMVDVATRSIELAALFGAGVDIAAGGGAVTVDGRWHLGLTSIDAADDPERVNHSIWSVQLGYALRVGGGE